MRRQARHLVTHQRDERAHDNHSVHAHRGSHGIHERLPASGGEYGEKAAFWNRCRGRLLLLAIRSRKQAKAAQRRELRGAELGVLETTLKQLE